ncbi:pentatricopeptide repeat-containing protein At1g59720, chloroplastic/mitochondrial-like [Apium graveolens]|uniref:DYW domain-containing protein n=1 Tax=Apium graveolens TaxID=4045 RepID=A0A6L5BA33_APIGR|nr:hypothetical protein AG4045_002221 [Apium graveolens]
MALSVISPNIPSNSHSPPLHKHHKHHAYLLNLLAKSTSLSQLKQIQAHTLRTTCPNFPDTLFLNTRIFHVSSLHDLDYTFHLFSQFQNPNSFVWNTLIRACANNEGKKEEVFGLYKSMLCDGSVMPDKYTFPIVLKACAYLFSIFEGRQLHCHVWKLGFGLDGYVNNSLIHFYGSCGCLDEAQSVFREMRERSVVSWNVIIDVLVRMGGFDEAVKLFREMKMVFEPDGYGMQSMISACAGLKSLALGMWCHCYVLRKFSSEVGESILLNNALVDMYCKCGAVDIATQVFERMKKRDIHSWNSMILGFAMHGKAEAALECFDCLVEEEELVPNSITFTGVLAACNHRGLVVEGRRYFDIMVNEYNIQPVLEHYGSLVDLLGRAGHIDEALDIIANMPMKPDVVIWRSILDACSKKNGGLELSEEVARQIFESERVDCSGAYVLLSRVYAVANRWNEVGLIRNWMTNKGVKKEPGCSSIEMYGISHEFFAGDTSHSSTKEIYKLLDVIDKRLETIGYVPDVSQAPMIDEEELVDGKRHSLRLHSERLAIAYGLLNLPPGVPIRVFKNLRVCNDCHNVTKLISKIYNVDIIVRDRTRFHHFRNGSCSCMDYW